MQSTDARYIGYLNGLRRMARELDVSWPPYALDEGLSLALSEARC